ncbi:MAG: hypothetical protein L6V85_08020 [Clostridiales bacterium]|nr:MAG: hypothetical protein L6V85_08020 [Clostridiales bacterium]
MERNAADSGDEKLKDALDNVNKRIRGFGVEDDKSSRFKKYRPEIAGRRAERTGRLWNRPYAKSERKQARSRHRQG